MSPELIMERTKDFVQDAYRAMVNPLPVIRRVYPDNRFKGGKMDVNRTITGNCHIEFSIDEAGVDRYFYSIEEAK